ncbi:MAG: phosphatidylserine/phosphatidylglycerophosphate/cardiolipin synthase family protein [Candidatus Sericytochromatia bacterium]|nr:phosphatidylserine/phosphatidylglycerophosphate/cardiolipin synthase family protein [Candidatus Sericytochromatia bacterium]
MPTLRDRILRLQQRRLPGGEAWPAASKTPGVARRVIARSGTFGVEQLALTAPSYRNRVDLHVTADESRGAILRAIREADEAFWIEIFIWHDDPSGREIADALIARKRQVEAQGQPFDARVLIDWSGLRDGAATGRENRIVERLRAGGVEVLAFNRGGVDPTAAGATPITHRKLFIQDGTRFLSGGRNIGDEYLQPTFLNPRSQREHAWHDLMFTVSGEETQRVQREFLKNWVNAGGELPPRLPISRLPASGSAWVQSVVTDPHRKKTELRDTHLKLIRYAERELRLVYPYFSDDAMIAELIAAKRRNPALDIKVMLPGKGERGLPGLLFGNLNLETARQLTAAGIEVRFVDVRPEGEEWVEAFSHFKALEVDGKVLSLGSANGDARTLSHNHELNAVIRDPALARDFVQRVLEPDWRRARPAPEVLAAQPWWRRLVQLGLEAVDFLL